MILLMGVAGAGKSMQGRMLADEHGYAWISTGEILRVLVTGKRRQEMLQGKLLSDEEVIDLIHRVFYMIDTKQQFVLDGFPRTVPQAKWLIKQSEEGRFNLDAIINMNASPEVVYERLEKRGRPDDTKDAIERRIREYEEVTKPILDCFAEKKVPLCNINADQDPRTIHDEILAFIDDDSSLV